MLKGMFQAQGMEGWQQFKRLKLQTTLDPYLRPDYDTKFDETTNEAKEEMNSRHVAVSPTECCGP